MLCRAALGQTLVLSFVAMLAGCGVGPQYVKVVEAGKEHSWLIVSSSAKILRVETREVVDLRPFIRDVVGKDTFASLTKTFPRVAPYKPLVQMRTVRVSPDASWISCEYQDGAERGICLIDVRRRHSVRLVLGRQYSICEMAWSVDSEKLLLSLYASSRTGGMAIVVKEEGRWAVHDLPVSKGLTVHRKTITPRAWSSPSEFVFAAGGHINRYELRNHAVTRLRPGLCAWSLTPGEYLVETSKHGEKGAAIWRVMAQPDGAEVTERLPQLRRVDAVSPDGRFVLEHEGLLSSVAGHAAVRDVVACVEFPGRARGAFLDGYYLPDAVDAVRDATWVVDRAGLFAAAIQSASAHH